MGGVTPDDIAPEFRSSAKSYQKAAPIEGVRTIRLPRFTDDRGFFLELFRARANHAGSAELADFFQGVPVAQVKSLGSGAGPEGRDYAESKASL